MKKLIILAFAAIAAFASTLEIGQEFEQKTFKDQHEQTLEIKKDTKEIIIAFTKQDGNVVKTFLDENRGYLKENNSIYLTDVSSVPSFVMSFFMLPKFKEYHYKMGLVEDEALSSTFPRKKDHLTVLKLNNFEIVSIEFKNEL